MKTKKTPLRMCLGCSEMFPKKDLIRVVKSKEGEISLDFTGKKSGRGAYLCKSGECFAKMPSGPSINILIKLMTIISLVFAPLIEIGRAHV